MSTIGRFFSRVVEIDRLRVLVPYNAAAFDVFARRYADGPKSSRFYAMLSAVLAVLMLLGACAFLAMAAKSRYLDAWGIEVPGRILDASFHADRYRKQVEWKAMNYQFTTRSGAVVSGRVDRPVRELANLPDSDRFTVLYWDRFPGVNAPRGVESNARLYTALAAVLLLGSIHFSCLWRRMTRWHRCVMARTASTEALR